MQSIIQLCVIDHVNAIGPHLLDILKEEVADPLMTVLYPQVSQNTTYHGELLNFDIGSPTDYRYGFSIGYANAAKKKGEGSKNISRVGLDCHTDDSEVLIFTKELLENFEVKLYFKSQSGGSFGIDEGVFHATV